MLALRDALTAEERAAASSVIAISVNELLAARLAPGSVIAMYSAKGSEVDTARIDQVARERGFVVAYPRVIDDGRSLAFHAVTIAELAPARFGLREPSADAAAVAVAAIAAFVVPGLAFDRAGGRIGWGRGHYDATFAAAAPAALRIGLAFECQMIDEVTLESHDMPLHFIITEAETHTVA